MPWKRRLRGCAELLLELEALKIDYYFVRHFHFTNGNFYSSFTPWKHRKSRTFCLLAACGNSGLHRSPKVIACVLDFDQYLVHFGLKLRPRYPHLRFVQRLFGKQIHGVRQLEAYIHAVLHAKAEPGECCINYKPAYRGIGLCLIENKKRVMRLDAETG